ncbi:MAG: ferritin family protein [Desulfococcaceae bacterium]|jgi:rubrerythrin|nr:ferritin family protein [Desulfococcaceae bacterium]
MKENDALKILKNAILLERRGQAFYRKVAEQTDSSAVKDFFNMMAEEEENHIRILSEQFVNYKEKGMFKPGNYIDRISQDTASEILHRELQEKIAAAGFESAAIGAAIAMEERAVAIYERQAETGEDREEKKLYSWLADWEKSHLNILLEMDRELTGKIWNDNRFWPF